MSLEINWRELIKDDQLNESLKVKLNQFFKKSLNLPNYLENFEILNLKLNSENSPSIIIKDITNPLPEFYEEDKSCENSNDIQLLLDCKYETDLYLEFETNLKLNYPVDKFMRLPIKFRVTFLALHILCLLCVFENGKKVTFSILCDIDDNETTEKPTHPISRNIVGSPFERLSIIKNLSIETEIGEGEEVEDSGNRGLNTNSNNDNAALRSVDKLEEWLLDKFKSFLRTEVGWPSWITFDLNENGSDIETDDTADDDDYIDIDSETSS
ncbi:hypothetical protein KAFR_0A05190 [Kazachstania africana CBS 2517]|uniref:SMP-LTD domain-containing protein n=1 Tax=Kazachstania africana (strain ATCC 22294 / BCRC 22015 / CBS 2517 / CECT 1963 / NBRC 1671 / NRRL Y-8276) TaxID=1071382 RepID=H2ANK4_KAZAF|nr:hypothetical protein KAFR_0A05190 [Kazachstania africana CBS 2517]CCF55954.1 hypothetical protein KAFR_0A05190 [Kazachstania africana CBS 2517]